MCTSVRTYCLTDTVLIQVVKHSGISANEYLQGIISATEVDTYKWFRDVPSYRFVIFLCVLHTALRKN